MSIRQYIVSQFRQPRGSVGRLAGYIMDRRPSNRQRNSWTVDLLDLQPESNVLEIGCGPGLALDTCLEQVRHGTVVGLDHSELMVHQALVRLRDAVEDGRCSVRLGDVSVLEESEEQYDRIFSVNVVQFFSDLEDTFRILFSRLKPGGMVATTYMPRMKNATAEDAVRKATEVQRVMESAGYTEITAHNLPIEPVPATCVTGLRPK